jgi:8-oxo-dGTP pyrophosphatase MutT (NUDIX family)
MADGSHTTVTIDTPSGGLVSGLREFSGAHGGAKAVIEYVGRRGARIVLVGNDGEWGDQFAESTAVAREACEKAGITVENEWERELVELMRPTNDLWRSMSKRTLSR